jgi:hypothetical protein
MKSEYGRELHKAGKSAKAWDNFVKNSHKYSTKKEAIKKTLEKHGEKTTKELKGGLQKHKYAGQKAPLYEHKNNPGTFFGYNPNKK